jgi:RNA-directed DNA polymerase
MAESQKAYIYRIVSSEANLHRVLQRMRVNGFWPYSRALPDDPPAEAQRRAAIESELARLRALSAAVVDPQKALAKERKRRMAESKRRRAEAKQKRVADHRRRREAFALLRRNNIVHLGRGVSAGLQDQRAPSADLASRGLPALRNGADLAMMLGIPLARLRWLTFHRLGATTVHYHRFEIPKKTGGTRAISAPKPHLAAAQRWVLKNLLERLTFSPQAHGFVRYRSTVTNAQPHVGKAVVFNLDLKDFFPSITFRRVKGFFGKLGYNEHVATVLALLCTEPPRAAATLDGRRLWIALGARVLPQGACTSPAITNLLCATLDKRLAGLARRHGFTFTRYADDLTFSGDDAKAVGGLLRSVRSIVGDEGLTENPAKTKVMRKGVRQEVTGVVVNTRVSIPREERRRLRAVLHNAAREGLDAQNRAQHPAFEAHLRGKVAYVSMVNPAQGAKLQQQLDAALARPRE